MIKNINVCVILKNTVHCRFYKIPLNDKPANISKEF